MRSVLDRVRVQGAAGCAATGAAGRTPLPVPKYPWRYADPGELASGVLGATDKAGSVVVRRGLGAAKEAEVLRHEFWHRWLTPLADDGFGFRFPKSYGEITTREELDRVAEALRRVAATD